MKAVRRRLSLRIRTGPKDKDKDNTTERERELTTGAQPPSPLSVSTTAALAATAAAAAKRSASGTSLCVPESPYDGLAPSPASASNQHLSPNPNYPRRASSPTSASASPMSSSPPPSPRGASSSTSANGNGGGSGSGDRKKPNRLAQAFESIIGGGNRQRRDSNAGQPPVHHAGNNSFLTLAAGTRGGGYSNSSTPIAASPMTGSRPNSMAFSDSRPTSVIDPNMPNGLFGLALPTMPEQLINGVPLVVYRCIQCLLKRGVEVEGIFRVPAAQLEVKNIRAMYDRGEDPDLQLVVKTAHVAPALLKLYLRELKDPLLTYEHYDMFISAAGIPSVPERIKKLNHVFQMLPPVNAATVHYIMSFMKIIAANSAVNKMDANNLSVVFVPNILRPREIGDEAKDAPLARQVMNHMIEDFDQVFDGIHGPTVTVNADKAVVEVTVTEATSPLTELEHVTTAIDLSFKAMTEIEEDHEGPEDLPDVVITSTTPVLDGKDTFLSTPSVADEDAGPVTPTNEVVLLGASLPADGAAAKKPRKKSVALSGSVSPKQRKKKLDGPKLPVMQDQLPTAAAPKPQRVYITTVIGEDFLKDVKLGKLEDVQRKIKNGLVDINCTDKQGYNGLMIAVISNDFNMVKVLLEAGCDHDLQNDRGETALHKAAISGSIESARLLLDAGANVHKRDNDGRSPIINAACAGEKNMCELLLQRGAELDDKDELTNKTPLIFASYAGHEDTVELLVKKGADVNHIDNFQWSALMFAAYTGKDRLVRILLKSSAMASLANHKGKTAASIAADQGHTSIADAITLDAVRRRRRAAAAAAQLAEANNHEHPPALAQQSSDQAAVTTAAASDAGNTASKSPSVQRAEIYDTEGAGFAI